MLKPFSFSSTYRLTNFKDCFDNAQKILGKGLIVFFKPADSVKLGIIVSKKTEKKANKRNKIKRRIREIFRLNKPSSGDFIILARNYILNMEYSDIQNEYLSLLKRIK